jgi:glycosyltransferase involved in cell wall biosynthesis
MNPKISVIFPVGNRESFLAEALESILAQTFKEFELLIIMDGAPAAVTSIVERYQDDRIQMIRLPVNLGISNARNAGLLASRAPYIAFMDSDDVAMPERLTTQHAWMDAHPDVTLCASNSIKLLSDGRRVHMVYPETDGMIKSRLLLVDSAILHPTAMLRSDFIRRHALRNDANFPRDQSHRFYVEMMRRGATFYGLQEELLLYRRHAENVTRDSAGVDAEKTRVREVLLPVFFPELTGNEYQILLRGLCQDVQFTLEEACRFIVAIMKAMNETRSFKGEDRQELRRILALYHRRVLQSLESLQPAQ